MIFVSAISFSRLSVERGASAANTTKFIPNSERAAESARVTARMRVSFAQHWLPLLNVLTDQEHAPAKLQSCFVCNIRLSSKNKAENNQRLEKRADFYFILQNTILAGTKSVIKEVKSELDALAIDGGQRRLQAMLVFNAHWKRHNYALMLRDGKPHTLSWSQVLRTLFDATNFDFDAMNDDQCFAWSGDCHGVTRRPQVYVCRNIQFFQATTFTNKKMNGPFQRL